MTKEGLQMEQTQQTVQRLSHRQVMFVRILEMNGPELEDEVRRQLDDNPALEVADSSESENDYKDSDSDTVEIDYMDDNQDDDPADYMIGKSVNGASDSNLSLFRSRMIRRIFTIYFKSSWAK